jgi:hypothetical protein
MADRVLITGARAPAALDIARSFKAAGFEVHMADSSPSRLSASSRAVTKMHRLPSPRRDFAGFRQAASDIIFHIKPTVVVPTCEEVFYLATLGAPDVPVFAPSPALLQRLHSKHAFNLDAADIGLATPETTRMTSADDLAPLLGDDLVFKPEYSRFGTQTLISPSRDARLGLRPTPQAPWVAQRRVYGREVCFYAVSVDSKLTAFSAYQSPWKFKGGAGYAFETLVPALHDQLLEIARVLAQRLIPKGQFACDLIVDAENVAWLLECNPRATSGVHFFGRSPALALAMLGDASTPLLVRDATARHVGPALWFHGLPAAITQRRMGEWRARRRESVDVISAPHDRAPVAGALRDSMRMAMRAILQGKTLTEISTIDIEWNGEPL